ncbi:MAG: hypothetical protein AB1646_19745 [Thermodesulfobacteriota bacterium]
MIQRLSNVLAVSLACPADVAVGDMVEIASSKTVAKLTTVGSSKLVGVVVVHRAEALLCTVETPFRERRDDRVAGEAVPVGPFVWGPANKTYAYTPGSVPRHDGTAVGPVTITAAGNDKVKIAVDGGTAVTVTLTAGTGRTFAQIAAEINAAVTGITAEVDAAGNLNLVGTEIGQKFEVQTVTNDAYTALGWTAATYSGDKPSHDAGAIAGLAITPATEAGTVVETLEY